MADYEERKIEAARDERYANLEAQRTRIESLVSAWMADATQLHTDSPLQEEKANLIAMRNGMVAALRAILGV